MALSDLFGINDITEEERLDQKLEDALKNEEDKRKKEVEKEDSEKEDQKTPDQKELNGKISKRIAGELQDMTEDDRIATLNYLFTADKKVRREAEEILSRIIKADPMRYYMFVLNSVDVDLRDQKKAKEIIAANAIDASKAQDAAKTMGKEVTDVFKIYLFEEQPNGPKITLKRYKITD